MIDGNRIEDRPYQERTVESVFSKWNGGARAVLVVSPPGSGKTEIGIKIMRCAPTAPRVLIVVHTRSLAVQWQERLERAFGEPVNVIMEGRLARPDARLHVAVVHSLLKRPPLRDIDLVILDEAHHYMADEWRAAQFMMKGKKPKLLGLTATPERDDGKALGDVFEQLVVAAQYSELIAGGWIVPARIVAPKRYLRSHYAQHPVDVWAAHSEGRSTLGFYPYIETAELYNAEFMSRGLAAAAFHSKQPEYEHEEAWESFEQERCKVLSTVTAAIEGLNVPHIGAVILGRSFDFVGGYLQATGRVLRAFQKEQGGVVTYKKLDGIVIDLTGATVRHGAPDMDREYSLTGRAISTGPTGPGPGYEPTLPLVLGLEMVLSKRGALSASDPLPAPLVLPESDPVKLRRAIEIKKAVRKMQTRHGAEAGRRLRSSLEALEL
jgi:superfamily II DNA or RNA helicase